MRRPYTWMYMLYSEWLVTEQNKLYNAAQRTRGWKTIPVVDFTGRVVSKGLLRLATVVAGKAASRWAPRIQLNDERAISHTED
jgi:hypothetical protein